MKIKDELYSYKESLKLNYNKISLFPSRFIYAPLFKVGSESGHLSDGFFSFLINILEENGVKINIWKKRPFPNKKEPRNHPSMWVELDNELFFFDKSDHIQELDVSALEICSKYFKDNYNRIEISRILKYYKMESKLEKIKPFFPFCDLSKVNKHYQEKIKLFDICQIMSIYKTPEVIMNDSYKIKFPTGYDHCYIRIKTYDLLKKKAGDLRTFVNLSCKDGSISKVNKMKYIPYKDYLKILSLSSIGMVNTIPHRILPWKFTEMICMGVLPALDERPITEFPTIFDIQPGKHFIEIFPDLTFINNNKDANPFDLSCYRALLPSYSDNYFDEHFDKFLIKVMDSDFISYIKENVNSFKYNVLLNKELIFDYIIDC